MPGSNVQLGDDVHDRASRKAVEAVRQMPSERQDAIAQWMLDLADEDTLKPFDAEDLAAIEEGLADIERGDFATNEEVKALVDRFRR